MNIYRGPSSSQKQLKVLKLRRKLHNNELKLDQNPDFILETSGDIRAFLTPTDPIEKIPKFPKGKPYKHNIIGGVTQLRPSIPLTTTNKMLSRKSTFSLFLRSQVKQILNIKEDSKEKFNKIMKSIQDNIERTKVEENEKLRFMKDKTKIQGMKQSQSIDAVFQPKLLSKDSKLSGKSNILPNELTTRNIKRDNKSEQFGFNDKMTWYMSLRESHENEHVESYMRIGSELNGLYTKVKRKNPFYSQALTGKVRSEDEELAVVGRNKLQMEAEAVKKVGYEYLRPDLLIREAYKEDTIIEHSNNMSEAPASNNSLIISRIENESLVFKF